MEATATAEGIQSQFVNLLQANQTIPRIQRLLLPLPHLPRLPLRK